MLLTSGWWERPELISVVGTVSVTGI